MDRFWSKVNKTNKCWEWTGTKNKKYGLFWLNGSMKRAHRVSYEMHCGPITDVDCVLHSCDNPSCVNPQHLFLGSQLDNMQDMIKKGRANKVYGENHPATELSDIDAWLIKNIDGVKQQVIADWFGTTQNTVSRIRNGKTWKHIEVGL